MTQRSPQTYSGLDFGPWELGKVTVVIPAFNEEAAIGHDLEAIFEAMDKSDFDYEVIVVDDGSTDLTAEIVAQFPRARLIKHPRNMGVGAARKTGIRLAEGDIIITTDGDGTYPNHEMPALLERLRDNDLVIGARTKEAGTMPWLRTPAKTFIRWLASYLTGVNIPDLNSGLRCFSKETAQQFFPLLPSGHSWESTSTLAFLTAGYRVEFVPVDYYPRLGGRSSFHPIKDTVTYLRLIFRTVMYFDPLKFFGPLCLALFLIGGLKLARDIVVFNFHIPGSTIVILLTAVQVGVLGLIADLIVKRSPPRTP